MHPAESARTTTVRLHWGRHRSGGRRRSAAGSWAMAWSSTMTWSATVLAPALPGRSSTGEHLAGGIGEAEHRVETEPSLEGGGGLLLSIGVDLDQGGIDVEDHRALTRGRLTTGTRPWPASRPWPRRCAARVFCIELMEGAEHRRVRRHRPEQVGLKAQVLDVGTALATPGQHQGDLDQDLPPVVDREPFTGRRDAGGK